VNLLAARYLAQAFQPVLPEDVPQPAAGAARNAIPLYDFPNVKVVKHFIAEAPLRTSALRTLGGYANVFALESFVDELALVAGADPVELRLRHLKDERAQAVIEAAAQRAGWQPGLLGDGTRGRGFAFARYKNLACYCAIVADVEVDRKTGRVSVTHVVAAVDAGQIVNPDGVINQIEGGIIQSASWTLMESVRFDRTRVTTRSWSDYPILKFTEVPEVEVVLLDQPAERFLGVGEGAQGPTAAAIANGIANATGQAAPRAAVHRRTRKAGSGVVGQIRNERFGSGSAAFTSTTFFRHILSSPSTRRSRCVVRPTHQCSSRLAWTASSPRRKFEPATSSPSAARSTSRFETIRRISDAGSWL